MTVENGTLTALLVDKTGMSKKQVQQYLQELVSEVQAGAAQQKKVRIEGFGVFKPEDQIIRFEPSEILQTEINQKYVGMKPIELMGSFRESGSGIPVKEPKRSVSETERRSRQHAEKNEPAAAEKPPVKEQTSRKAPDEITGHPQPAKPETPKKSVALSEKETGAFDIVLIVISVVIALLLAGWLLYESGVFA